MLLLLHLIKKEILEHLMSLRFAIACVLCLIVILCSLFVRCQDYQQVMDDYTQESAMERTRMDTLSWPWGLNSDGLNVYRQPNPLKIFVRGLSDTNGGTVKVNGMSRLQPMVQSLRNTSVPLFSPMDLVAFVGLIMSLMAIVFGYDAVCGEKQRGTLRLMLSYSVPRHLVLLSKWIGGYVTLILPFLLTVIVGMVIVRIQKGVSFNADQWLRLAAIMGLSLLYVAAMFSLSIFVSCVTARPATSVMLLLSIWVVVVLAVPNLSPHVAGIFRPAPNATEMQQARSEIKKAVWKEADEKIKAYMKDNGIPDRWWENNPWGDWQRMEKIYGMWIFSWPIWKAGNLRVLNEFAKIDQLHAPKLEAQVALTRWIGRVSPFSCLAMAATELAGAGVMEDKRFMDQLRDYQVEFCEYAHDEGLAMELKEYESKGKNVGPWYKIRLKPVPVFTYVPPAAADYARAVALDAGILAGMALVLFMLGYVTFLRYDVR